MQVCAEGDDLRVCYIDLAVQYATVAVLRNQCATALNEIEKE